MKSTRVKIEFDAEADSSWLIDILGNENVITDLASRAIREFRRDWLKMNGFSSSGYAEVSLVSATAGNKPT